MFLGRQLRFARRFSSSRWSIMSTLLYRNCLHQLLLLFLGLQFFCSSDSVDPCRRQPYYSLCHNGSERTYRSQLVLRYYLFQNECISYPYGLCKNDVPAAKLFRYQHQCEKACLGKQSEYQLPTPDLFGLVQESSSGIVVEATENITTEETEKVANGPVFKPGICPFPEVGEYAVCVRECHLDYECPRDQKCCYNGCGRLCLEPKTSEGDHCVRLKDHGGCYGYFRRWWYDEGIDGCQQFIYGGCGGNGNNFLTESDCVSSCQRRKNFAANLTTQSTPIDQFSTSPTISAESSSSSAVSNQFTQVTSDSPIETITTNTTVDSAVTSGTVSGGEDQTTISIEPTTTSWSGSAETTTNDQTSTLSLLSSLPSLSSSSFETTSATTELPIFFRQTSTVEWQSSEVTATPTTTTTTTATTTITITTSTPTSNEGGSAAETSTSGEESFLQPPHFVGWTPLKGSGQIPTYGGGPGSSPTLGGLFPQAVRVSNANQTDDQDADPDWQSPHFGRGFVNNISYVVQPRKIPELERPGVGDGRWSTSSAVGPAGSTISPKPVSSTELIRCPHSQEPLRDHDGSFLQCLPEPAKRECPSQSACFYNGLNFYCCPSVELLYGEGDKDDDRLSRSQTFIAKTLAGVGGQQKQYRAELLEILKQDGGNNNINNNNNNKLPDDHLHRDRRRRRRRRQ